MRLILFLIFISLAGCNSIKNRGLASVNRPPQFVLLAFDGSRSLSMWEETTRFANQNDIKFTYFVSGVYFLARSHRSNYVEPLRGRGRSNIGWGKGEADISQRFRAVQDALQGGHEIASHANGHYDGSGFSYNDWVSELQQFDSFLSTGVSRYNVLRMPKNWNYTIASEIQGFRAPLLAKNSKMNKALRSMDYSYDTSRIDKMNYWPQRIEGVWNFPLAGIRKSRTNTKTLSMDYNFYFSDSEGRKGNAQDFQFFEDQMFETYINYFSYNYYGTCICT